MKSKRGAGKISQSAIDSFCPATLALAPAPSSCPAGSPLTRIKVVPQSYDNQQKQSKL